VGIIRRPTSRRTPLTNSQGDFSNIKHCEYSNADHTYVISLALAYGETAKQRMDQNKATPGTKQVPGFGDEATWEPLQGTFTARFNDRCADIKVSKAHGDDQKRIQYAKEITRLALGQP
jgi:hypothetical protein